MTKERRSSKEPKKKPSMTLKQKRNAKKEKQEANTFLGSEKPA